jgi:hypothetical protein
LNAKQTAQLLRLVEDDTAALLAKPGCRRAFWLVDVSRPRFMLRPSLSRTQPVPRFLQEANPNISGWLKIHGERSIILPCLPFVI